MISLRKSIQCPKCDEINKIDLSDYVVDESTYEREMGDEVEYTIGDCVITCKHCEEEFEISGSIWEYPEGMENDNALAVE